MIRNKRQKRTHRNEVIKCISHKCTHDALRCTMHDAIRDKSKHIALKYVSIEVVILISHTSEHIYLYRCTHMYLYRQHFYEHTLMKQNRGFLSV